MPIWFHVTTPLTKSQLLYAIETTFVKQASNRMKPHGKFLTNKAISVPI